MKEAVYVHIIVICKTHVAFDITVHKYVSTKSLSHHIQSQALLITSKVHQLNLIFWIVNNISKKKIISEISTDVISKKM